jgi:hypothetical protein
MCGLDSAGSGRGRWWALGNAEMNLFGSLKGRKYLN